MKEVSAATLEFMAEKERQEENRRRYLLRKFGADGLWKLQQEAMTELAKLRPELTRKRLRTTDG
jgi:hypothetical protein